MVLKSHSKLGETGEKKGFWVEEFGAPYYFFLDARADITLASPKAGQPPVDPKSGFADLAPGLRFGEKPIVSGEYLFLSA